MVTPVKEERQQQARHEAIDWFVRLSSGTASDQDRQHCAAWRAQDPLNEQAWARVETVRHKLQEVPAQIAAPTLNRPAPRRRDLLRGSALAIGALGVGSLAWRGWVAADGASLLADARTGVGEQREMELPDGSLLVMNTRTAVDIRFDHAARRLKLHGGEVMIVSAHERSPVRAPDPRPLTVDTTHGRLRALGTRFLVRHEGTSVQVSVLSSAVEAASHDGRTLRVEAGQRLALSPSGLGKPQPAPADVDAWASGHLVFDNQPLAEVLAELSRYRRGHLGCDPAAAGLRVSGVFPVKDTDQALAALSASLDLQVDRFTRYWVTLRARRT